MKETQQTSVALDRATCDDVLKVLERFGALRARVKVTGIDKVVYDGLETPSLYLLGFVVGSLESLAGIADRLLVERKPNR